MSSGVKHYREAYIDRGIDIKTSLMAGLDLWAKAGKTSLAAEIAAADSNSTFRVAVTMSGNRRHNLLVVCLPSAGNNFAALGNLKYTKRATVSLFPTTTVDDVIEHTPRRF